MALTVLNVAYPLAPVGADAVGGAEQVVAQLDAALTDSGDSSIVIASEGSDVKGTLLSIPSATGSLTSTTRTRIQAATRERIRNALQTLPIDIVHLHGVDFEQYLPPEGVPTLVTLHLPPSFYSPGVFHLTRPDTYLHCVSESQHKTCPPCANMLPPIRNGVALNARARNKRRFAMSIGRICPEKGCHIAMDAAKRAKIPFILAGQVFGYPEHEAYFQREIAPRLDRQHRFIGPVGLQKKCHLLSAVTCLLAPSLVAETSSLVAMEALACGTPVIGFRIGALPEIIEHGKTGFIVNNEHEMAQAIKSISAINPEDCRSAARTRFSLTNTAAAYLSLYRRLTQTHSEAPWTTLALTQ